MSEYYDHYHRWEPLAEFHFNLNDSEDEYDDDNYLYCLCSRAYIRDGVKPYNVDKEDGSESDMEVPRDTGSQGWENESHVHFSLDTSYKVKCEKDEGASCYCSASHTDNCCSTDEHDAVQMHGTSHALQPSDSGADLTYQDCHSENTNPEKLERMDQDFPNPTENYLSEGTWDKFWAVNGERLIWASWIKKYSDYINPAYLDENNDLIVDDNNIPKQRSVDQIYNESKNEDDSMRERKFSYDSKVNPYKKGVSLNQTEKAEKNENKDESWLPCSRRRSCSEHERIVSPRTLAGTDSMTNVTKITLSSYDVTSSHVTSESSPTDDYSVSSSNSDDQSNDQTRIANVEEPTSIDDMDTDQYWQFLWKKHFGEQYALHFANYVEIHAQDLNDKLPSIKIQATTEEPKKAIEKSQDKILDIECENSEGNSQELPTVIEIQTQVEEINLEDTQKSTKAKKRGKKQSNKYLGSVGVLLQNLLKDEILTENNKLEQDKITDENRKLLEADEVLGDNNKIVEASETGVDSGGNDGKVPEDGVVNNENSSNIQQSVSNTNFTSYSYDDGDDEPPEETPINLKRSHEIDHEEAASEKIKATFEMMGFCIEDNNIPKGQMVFRKRMARLRPPRYKNTRRFGRKTYFDEDGKPMDESKDSQDERDMQTDDDLPCPDFRSEALRLLNTLEQNVSNDAENDTAKVESIISHSKTEISETGEDKAQNTTNNDDKCKSIAQDVSEEMNVDVNDSISVDNRSIVNLDDRKIESSGSSKSAKIDSEDMNKDTNKKPNSSKNYNLELNIDKDGDKQEFTDQNMPTNEVIEQNPMNADCKDTIQHYITENSIEIISTKTANSFLETITTKNIGNYDVQNKVENDNCDENIAVNASEVPLPDDLDQSSDEKQEALDNSVTLNVESTKRRRRQKRYAKLDEEELSNVPSELRDDPKMMKYWKKRHSLFHRFDEGIRLDRESWFSVTPENVARHIARKYTYDTVLDAFCGAGGNTIQFAFTSKKVIAVDIDPAKVEMARHNASVYGVADRIHFIVGDFFQLAPTLEADMVFLSPPWGGPNYSDNAQYDIETMLEPKPASELMSVARTISPTISLYLPRNTRPDQILSLAKDVGGSVEVEQSYLDKRFVAITAYFY